MLENIKIGFGTWKIEHDKTYNAVKNALLSGYRLIDTAYVYGNEKAVGEAIRDSLIKREEIIVTTKLWNTFQGYEKTIKGFMKSLENLNLDYIDIFLIHWPIPKKKRSIYPKNIIETWKALEYLKENGYIKEIGVCNFEIEHLKVILENSNTKPFLNQIELHLGYMNNSLIEFCFKNGIIVEAWSPLKNGDLSFLDNFSLLLDKYKITKAELAISYLINKNIIPLIKAEQENHLLENINAVKIKIEDRDLKELDNYFDNYKGHDPNNIEF